MPRSRIACVELAAAVGMNLVGALGKTSRAFKKLAPQEAAAPEEKGRDQVEQRRHEEVAHHEHLPHADTIRWHTHIPDRDHERGGPEVVTPSEP